MLIVSDTSPILNLVAVERLELLKDLYGSIVIPPAVSAELHDNGTFLTMDWIQVVEPANRAAVEALHTELDAGESEAIVLAQQLNASLLLIDERLGRRAAAQLGLDVTGLLGILAEAKKVIAADRVVERPQPQAAPAPAPESLCKPDAGAQKIEDDEDEAIDVSMAIEADADDLEAMAATMVVDYHPGDTLGKLMALVNQLRMSSEGTREYLFRTCIMQNVKPIELLLWIRTRWGSLTHCLESTLLIQKVCYRLSFLLFTQRY